MSLAVELWSRLELCWQLAYWCGDGMTPGKPWMGDLDMNRFRSAKTQSLVSLTRFKLRDETRGIKTGGSDGMLDGISPVDD